MGLKSKSVKYSKNNHYRLNRQLLMHRWRKNEGLQLLCLVSVSEILPSFLSTPRGEIFFLIFIVKDNIGPSFPPLPTCSPLPRSSLPHWGIFFLMQLLRFTPRNIPGTGLQRDQPGLPWTACRLFPALGCSGMEASGVPSSAWPFEIG